jgi:two-component system NtrC family response regulator
VDDYRILIIDDDEMQLTALAGFLKSKKFQVDQTVSAVDGLQRLEKNQIDLILTDFKMPEKSGIEVLNSSKMINPNIDVVLMTAYGNIESAKEAIQSGAIDYLTKPIDLLQLENIINKTRERKQLISENQLLKQQLAEKTRLKNIISTSQQMEEVLSRAARVAASKATVMIRGESGTGKERIALGIHAASPRKDNNFLAVNCAAISETLLESTLFGHEKGAFTGALQQVKGRFELASGGTLFIDEVGDIPLSVQIKLLRVIQESAFERVGGTETIQVDSRIIAATNRDLERMVEEGTFREDLYYRLNVVSIQIPPLRERRADIIPLIDHFLNTYSNANQFERKNLSKEALDRLLKYNYPGNVRELENIIEQAVVLSRQRIITQNDLPLSVMDAFSVRDSSSDNLETKVAECEKKLIREALNLSNGVQTKAAELLGLSERNLRYKLTKFKMK